MGLSVGPPADGPDLWKQTTLTFCLSSLPCDLSSCIQAFITVWTQAWTRDLSYWLPASYPSWRVYACLFFWLFVGVSCIYMSLHALSLCTYKNTPGVHDWRHWCQVLQGGCAHDYWGKLTCIYIFICKCKLCVRSKRSFAWGLKYSLWLVYIRIHTTTHEYIRNHAVTYLYVSLRSFDVDL